MTSTFTKSASLLSEQVQWGSPEIVRGGIDQSRLAISDETKQATAFSFLVMGDTDAGIADGPSQSTFSAGFAQQMMRHLGESRFLLHTGDVTYPVGNYENYLAGFLQPYRDLLGRLPGHPDDLKNSVVFKRPLLPVPGNHDYASLSGATGGWQRFLRFACDRLRGLGIDLGHYGGEGGEAYGQLFLDQLKGLTSEQRRRHLTTHYDAVCERLGGEANWALTRCLNYRPGQFTRLPNRYYQFCYGGVDFFALDSNSWNMSSSREGFDQAQLDWLVRSLVESWRSSKTVGRIVYLHHSPYTTETSRWQQSETLWVRKHLRAVLDRVAVELAAHGISVGGPRRPMVDLVLGGHAHCFEHVRTLETNHADGEMDWIVCGGSGVDVRRQRRAGSDILEQLTRGGRSYTHVVAKSLRYGGVHGRNRQQMHSFLRVDVDSRAARPFSVTPFSVRRIGGEWRTDRLDSLSVGGDRARALAL